MVASVSDGGILSQNKILLSYHVDGYLYSGNNSLVFQNQCQKLLLSKFLMLDGTATVHVVFRAIKAKIFCLEYFSSCNFRGHLPKYCPWVKLLFEQH